MVSEAERSVAARLAQLFRYLGLERVHVAARRTADWHGLATTHPQTIASLTLVCPAELPVGGLQALAPRLLVITGDQGPPAAAVRRALGSVASLEARGRSTGYLGVVRNTIEEAGLQPGDAILDVGCGTGVLDRWLVRRTGGAHRLVAVDIHRTLLREAVALARREGLQERIAFLAGDAQALPFRDASFDLVLSATVMELLDAERMLRELLRVAKPGGRVAVVVRAVDLRSVVNLPLREALKAKVEAIPNGVAGPQGCADASLYRRFRRAGLEDVRMLPQLATYTDAASMHGVHERILAALTPGEAEEWQDAVARAQAEGTFFIALPFHCAVGTKRA
jgi:ubiquinone/menaquinone biosynthesis C-methylase UbiE